MKVTLHFNLPEEQEEFADALDGSSYRLVLVSLDQRLRDCVKYDTGLTGGALSEDEKVVLEKLRELLFELIQDANVSID